MKKNAVILGALFGLLAVGLGAFGAHGLEKILLENEHTDTFQTANKYHFLHAFLLMIIGLLAGEDSPKLLRYALIFCVSGLIIFSGSLYFLSIFVIERLGAVTPAGGLLLMLSWLMIILHFVKSKNE